MEVDRIFKEIGNKINLNGRAVVATKTPHLLQIIWICKGGAPLFKSGLDRWQIIYWFLTGPRHASREIHPIKSYSLD